MVSNVLVPFPMPERNNFSFNELEESQGEERGLNNDSSPN